MYIYKQIIVKYSQKIIDNFEIIKKLLFRLTGPGKGLASLRYYGNEVLCQDKFHPLECRRFKILFSLIFREMHPL